MSEPTDAWLAASAAALCTASRWVFLPSLALAVVAAGALLALPIASTLARITLSLAAAAGLAQAAIALRVEFDRPIFAALSGQPGGVAGFDAALQEAGWMPASKAGRPMLERANGLRRWVRIGGLLFAIQLAALLLAAWSR